MYGLSTLYVIVHFTKCKFWDTSCKSFNLSDMTCPDGFKIFLLWTLKNKLVFHNISYCKNILLIFKFNPWQKSCTQSYGNIRLRTRQQNWLLKPYQRLNRLTVCFLFRIIFALSLNTKPMVLKLWSVVAKP